MIDESPYEELTRVVKLLQLRLASLELKVSMIEFVAAAGLIILLIGAILVGLCWWKCYE